MAQVPATRSDMPHSAPPRFNRPVTCGAFSQTAATYQTARSTARTVTTGRILLSRALLRRTGSRLAATASVIAVTRPESYPHAVCYLQKLRRLAGVQIPVGGQIAVDHLQNAPWTRRHHDDLRRQEDRFRGGVGDEDHRNPGLLP